MSQQTAIEWLVEQLQSRFGTDIERLSITDQAKQLEKEQIMHAYENGENRSAELYYKETYNK